MKKIISLIIILSLVISLVGCGLADTSSSTVDNTNLGEQMQQESVNIAKNQSSLVENQPTPILTYSNERANQIKKAETFGSDPNKISWIYCFLPNGSCTLFTSVKGKVSNLSSYLTPDTTIVEDPFFYTAGMEGRVATMKGIAIQAPDIDGSYGTNGEGIFWYDTAGIYHQWNGYYMMFDEPVKLNIEPMIVMNVENK